MGEKHIGWDSRFVLLRICPAVGLDKEINILYQGKYILIYPQWLWYFWIERLNNQVNEYGWSTEIIQCQ